MKTALVVTAYLVPEERFAKTVKFIRHYQKLAPDWDIIVLDNNSPAALTEELYAQTSANIISFPEHFDRPSLLDYRYLWRAVHYLGTIFSAGYWDKIVYMDNDFFVLSEKMFSYIDSLTEGWTTFWSSSYNFPETGCHIVVNGCAAYHGFVTGPMDEFIARHNGSLMEEVLPVTHIERDLVGDRYGEFGLQIDKVVPERTNMDYWAQALLKDMF